MVVLSRTLTLLSYFIAFLAITTYNLAEAADFSLTAPTVATRWVAGQQGLVIAVSLKRAKADPPSPSDTLMRVTLERKGFIGSTTVATIREVVQLLMKPTDTVPAQLTISDFIVPADMPPGNKYFVLMKESGLFGAKAESDTFEIIAAPGNNTGPTTPIPTATLPPTPTNTTAPTPTLPGGQTCSVKSTVKSTFQSTGGPTAALAFMLLVVMTLF
ncbi:hypothetical protein BGX34_002366 [Mortierella sp. NVP85]|nr:hypothetical protein BGX34_002366 [Mortierella sp. NVP85]